MERVQIHLVKMEGVPSRVADKTYNFVLSVLGIFSRYVFLRALPNKEALHVANELKYIFSLFGNPCILQCDRGSEFKGKVVLFTLHIPCGYLTRPGNSPTISEQSSTKFRSLFNIVVGSMWW